MAVSSLGDGNKEGAPGQGASRRSPWPSASQLHGRPPALSCFPLPGAGARGAGTVAWSKMMTCRCSPHKTPCVWHRDPQLHQQRPSLRPGQLITRGPATHTHSITESDNISDAPRLPITNSGDRWDRVAQLSTDHPGLRSWHDNRCRPDLRGRLGGSPRASAGSCISRYAGCWVMKVW
jgi:hypothetical protein